MSGGGNRKETIPISPIAGARANTDIAVRTGADDGKVPSYRAGPIESAEIAKGCT